MLLLERPPKPDGFDQKMKGFRETVELAVRAGEKPAFGDAWGDYKDILGASQHGKCAYCEAYVHHVDTGTLDHYRPKSEISELLEEGQERPGSSKADGRRLRQVSDRGYWWLAYEWTNWLFVCERCNVGWKRTLFPVVEGTRALSPHAIEGEKPLLLNPFGDEDPARHLVFDRIGQISPVEGSSTGFESIRTLGLQRESLRKDRERVARQVYQLITQLNKGSDFSVVENLLVLGNPEEPYAGMTRMLFEHEIEMSWDELEERFQELVRLQP